jgi:uncharacterized heparinase superfamily protein
VRGRLARASAVLSGRFSFVGEEVQFDLLDWKRQHISRLWTYHLHYFDYAIDLAWATRTQGSARYAQRFVDLARSWIERTATGEGAGWDPYPLSMRTLNWLYALRLCEEFIDERSRTAIVRSVFQQLCVLEARLEWHLRGNHLQRNLHALAVGGLLFNGPRAHAWRTRGLALLWSQIREQVLPDGCHFERSPMYHALALRDLLELIDLLRANSQDVPTEVEARAARAVSAYGIFSRPDGSLHRINDAADNGAPDHAYVTRLARLVTGRLPKSPARAWQMPNGGFHGFSDPGAGDRFIIDGSAPGPEYQPGHAHCGTFGFELDLKGRPVIVDSGVAGYDDDPLRTYWRSTRAHNTIAIADREQSEIWATFRIARRARVSKAESSGSETSFEFHGSCSPYHHLRSTHTRTVIRRGPNWWSIDDEVRTPLSHYRSYLHIHPDIDVIVTPDRAIARMRELRVIITWHGFDAVELVSGAQDPAQGWYAKDFGAAVAAPVLCAYAQGAGKSGWDIRVVSGA